MAQILYRGPQTHGVVVGPLGEEVHVPYDEATEVADEIADALVDEYPVDFTLVKQERKPSAADKARRDVTQPEADEATVKEPQ
jgi:hypothetical protein